ncbi:MAG: VOC family protein [Inquilinaceae bacterium]
MTDRPKARTCIFLKQDAKAAAEFYAATIPDSHVESTQAIGETMTLVLLDIMGTPFMVMDGNASFEPRHDHSIAIATRDQDETDGLWNALSQGGSEGPCGWLSDRFGVHWQVVPEALTHMLSAHDRDAAARAQAAMMTMKKIDVAAIEAAFNSNEKGSTP